MRRREYDGEWFSEAMIGCISTGSYRFGVFCKAILIFQRLLLMSIHIIVILLVFDLSLVFIPVDDLRFFHSMKIGVLRTLGCFAEGDVTFVTCVSMISAAYLRRVELTSVISFELRK
jgi:hypothetical protein